MTDRHDPTRLDIEAALERYLTEQQMTRRDLIARIGALGAVRRARTDRRRLHEWRRHRQLRRAWPRRLPRDARQRGPVDRSRDGDPRTDADADAGIRADHLQLARLHRRGRHPVVRGEVPGQGQVRAVRRHRGRVHEARHRRQRLRPVLPDLGRRPPVRAGRHAHPAREVAPPEPRQPRPRVAEPGLRPGQRSLGPVRLVDDRRRLRHLQGQRRADELEGALGPALQGPHLDDGRLSGDVRPRAHPARLLGQHRRTWPSSTRPSHCSRPRSRCSARTRTTRSGRWSAAMSGSA